MGLSLMKSDLAATTTESPSCQQQRQMQAFNKALFPRGPVSQLSGSDTFHLEGDGDLSSPEQILILDMELLSFTAVLLPATPSIESREILATVCVSHTTKKLTL